MRDRLMPGPVPTVADAAYWSACRARELRLRQCRACGSWHHPPLPLCPQCQCAELEWQPVTGPALLYTWTRVHVAMHPAMSEELPYLIAVVEFPDCGGVRLIAPFEHGGADAPLIGAACELYWLSAEDGQPVPAFRTSRHGGAVPAA